MGSRFWRGVNADLAQVSVANGTPGLVEVVDVAAMQVSQSLPTAAGAHTTAFDPERQRLYVFLPTTCQAEVFTNE